MKPAGRHRPAGSDTMAADPTSHSAAEMTSEITSEVLS